MNQQQSELWIKYEDALLRKGLGKLRISKLKTMFIMVHRGLDKPLIECTRSELEEFITRVHRDQFLKLDGKPLSGSTKADIKKFIKQYLKLVKGDDEAYPPEVKWIRTSISKDEKPEEKPTLSIEEVRRFSQCFTKAEYQMLVLLLFDTGFRIRELLSVKKRDLTWESIDDDNKCFWIKCNESKTEVRKVPIPLFSEDIQSFVNTSFYRGLNDDDKLFKFHYSNIVQLFKKHSMRAFQKRITPHCLRHSSATYYAGEYGGDVRLLSQRYGWTMNSAQLALYIRRSGTYQREGAKKSFTNEVTTLRNTLRKMESEMVRLDDVKTIIEELKRKSDEENRQEYLALRAKYERVH